MATKRRPARQDAERLDRTDPVGGTEQHVTDRTPTRNGAGPQPPQTRRARNASAALAHLKAAAERLGFISHAASWAGKSVRYPFECPNGHRFQRTVTSVLRCEQCEAEAFMARLHNLAEEREGECLDEKYLGTSARYRMRCRDSHEWTEDGRKLAVGRWCKECWTRRCRQLQMPAADARIRAQERRPTV